MILRQLLLIMNRDISNIPFIKYIGSKGKPVFISVGASYLSEIDEAIRALYDVGCSDITILHCILSYPTKPQDANLNIIPSLKRIYPNLKIGYSDHVAPDESMTTLSTAAILGAEVIEKHFTLDKTLLGNDHYHAGDPSDFKRAITNFSLINQILGSSQKTVFECEKMSRKEARRSIVLTRDMKKGDIIQPTDITAKRPGTGLCPSFSEIIIGKKIKTNLSEDYILTWDDFE